MKVLYVMVAIFGLLAGCAVTPERISVWPNDVLCANYGAALRQQLRHSGDLAAPSSMKAELDRRGLFRPQDDLSLATRESVRVGMSECLLYASWGAPTRRNRTASMAGVRIQHVYGSYYHGRYVSSRPSYVYTENGIVTGWQD